ncbi:protein CHUP1, chloroplastic-like isoform X2 [Durio zibethinus]|nr:protein CHUP1, chloroplastic-like isoform X2 [Durio zibethinus]XP_022715064.1 protein CHUP1, chloroplastic-like isoform X2 [Durio zibethinus]
MMLNEKRDLRHLLVKFGVAVAFSFAGFLYSQLRTRKTKPYLPPPPSMRVSDRCGEVDSGGNDRRHDHVQALKISSTSEPEEMSMQRTSVDNASVGLSPSIRDGGDVCLLPEFNDLVEEFDFSASACPSPKQEVETPRLDIETSRTLRSAEKDDYEQEIKHLRNMVRVLRERERNHEVQLLEYYGLKEQETAVLELQNRLKINNMEAKLFTLKIESLQSENQRLEGQVADHAKVVAELEAARYRIKMLKKKLWHEAEQNREQILNLQKRVARLQEQELKAPANKQDLESKLQRLKVLEGEAEELRKSNRRLQIENSELARKLESTQILANSVLEDPKTEALNEMNNCLRQENEDLTKQIEQLQADRCADVEELVYLRWINACLRYELRNYQPRPGKTAARDLSKSLSPKSEEKAKKLILEYARTEGVADRGMNSMDFDCDQWSSSQASYGTDTGDVDDSSFENSSVTKTTKSGKLKFFKNLRRLLRGKDSQASPTSKTDHQEDVDSPTWSSGRGNDSITMLQSHSDRVTTPSQSSTRTSLDVPRWRSLNVDHIKDIEKFRRNSDCSSYGYKRFILGRDDASESPLEHQLDQDSEILRKSDLVKFAEVLEESGPRSGKIHKKSASII